MTEIEPRAEILIKPGEADMNLRRIYAAFRQCRGVDDDLTTADPEVIEKFIRDQMQGNHETPLEFATSVFRVTCSRSDSHQFVRYRMASYCQSSQRYVRADDLHWLNPIPDERRTEQLNGILAEVVEYIEGKYRQMLDCGAKPEEARAVLPNCTMTAFVVSMNFRELLHFLGQRLCRRAQWPIRRIAASMLSQLRMVYPCVFENIGPQCVQLHRCPDKYSCGWYRAGTEKYVPEV